MRVALTPLSELAPAQLGAWEELAAAVTAPVPFSEPGFVLSARALEGGDRVALLTSSDASGTHLAVPLLPVPGYRKIPLPALTSELHGFTVLGDALLRPGQEEPAWRAALAHLRDRPPAPWLTLPVASAGTVSHAALRDAAAQTGSGLREVEQHERAVVRRRAEHTYLQGRVRGKHLKDLRRLRRLLGQDLGGEVALHDRTGDPAALEAFLRLEASGWKGRAGTAMAQVPGGRQFLQDLQRAWPDRLQLHWLGTAQVPAAVQLNLRSGTTSSCLKTGFDEALAARSPGLLLELDVLQSFHDDPSLELLDSCAIPGHAMAERLFPDTRSLTTALIPLDRRGWAASRATAPLLELNRRRHARRRPAQETR